MMRAGDTMDIEHRRVCEMIYALKNGEQCNRGRLGMVDPAQFIVDSLLGDGPAIGIPSNSVLVPIPRSTVTANVHDVRWSGLQLCKTLVKAGYGKRVEPTLRRWTKVRASSKVDAKDRLTVAEHIASFVFDSRQLRDAEAITLVDDVVTKGTTLVAAAVILRRSGLLMPITAFTAGRMVSQALHRDHRARMLSKVRWDGTSPWPRRIVDTR